MAYIFMEKMEKHLSKLTFYAMNFGHRIIYVIPKLDIIKCLFMHARLLKAHYKLRENCLKNCSSWKIV